MSEQPAPPSGDNLTRDQARERARMLDVHRYDIELDLTRGPEVFGSTTTVEFSCRQPGARSFIDLVAPRVHAVELNGGSLDPAEVAGAGRIELPGLQAANTLRVVADCAYTHTGTGMHRFVDPADGDVYVYTQFEPFDAHCAFACFDQPDLKAIFNSTVIAPAQWEVVANTVVAGRSEHGDSARWTFVPTPRISTYVTSFASGRLHVVRDAHDGIPLGFWCQRSVAPHMDSDELVTITRQGLDFFGRLFDYPYPFGKLDHLFLPELSGAMENVGSIHYSDDYIFRSKVTEHARENRANTMLHEIAHMWFGDLVTMAWWDDLWLKESFASYLAILALSEATRFRSAWTSFLLEDKAWGYTQDQLPTTHPIVGDVVDTATLWGNFDGVTYGKGAAVLKQLAAWVGREPFVAGMRAYFRRFEYGNTTLDDFLGVLEEASGRDLRAWSRAWLETAGVNTLRPDVGGGDTGDTMERVGVLQEAAPEHPTLRPHRIAVGCYDLHDGTLVRRRRVELDVEAARTEVAELAGERRPDLLLVNDDDLTFAKPRLDAATITALPELVGRFSESLPRALCLTAAWDMTRDAELPARDYLRIALAAAGSEPDVTMLETLLRRAHDGLVLYAARDDRERGLEQLAGVALEHLRSAPPGGDHQLAWARCFGAVARTPGQADALAALFGGEDSVDGLVVDAELRWHLLRRLIVLGRAGDAEIAAEVTRDPTGPGERQAAAARAARPSSAAKAAAWDELVEGKLSAATEWLLIDGFQEPDELELLEAYVQPFFESVNELWSRRRPQAAERLAKGMFPRYVVSADTLAAADEHLRSATPAPALRRSLLEARDGLRRALRAREAAGAAS